MADTRINYGGKPTWRVEEGVGDVFVCSIVGTRLTVGWWDPAVGFHTVGQGFRQRRHFYLEERTQTHIRIKNIHVKEVVLFSFYCQQGALEAHKVPNHYTA